MALATAALALGLALQAPAAPREHLITGELVKVDLVRRAVALKVTEKDASREVGVAVGPETRIVSRGRTLRLEDLRTGDPAKVLCVDKDGRHQARVLKTGASRYAVGGAGPRPKP